MSDNRDVPPVIRQQIQNALDELLYKKPLPSYAVLGLDFIVHAGVIQRIKTKCEIQCQVETETITNGGKDNETK